MGVVGDVWWVMCVCVCGECIIHIVNYYIFYIFINYLKIYV